MKIVPDKHTVTIRVEKFNKLGVEILEHIITQARKAREEAGISQRELSLRMNRSDSYVNKMERGEVVPTITDLLSMSVILEKPLRYFIPDFIRYEPEEEPKGIDGREWELLKAFRSIKREDVKEVAIKTIKDYAKLK